MSVLETVKEAIGVADERPTYNCPDCGETFQSEADPDSYWCSCPECGTKDIEPVEESA